MLPYWSRSANPKSNKGYTIGGCQIKKCGFSVRWTLMGYWFRMKGKVVFIRRRRSFGTIKKAKLSKCDQHRHLGADGLPLKLDLPIGMPIERPQLTCFRRGTSSGRTWCTWTCKRPANPRRTGTGWSTCRCREQSCRSWRRVLRTKSQVKIMNSLQLIGLWIPFWGLTSGRIGGVEFSPDENDEKTNL